MKKTEYKQYLQSDHWNKMKRIFYNSRKHKCLICLSTNAKLNLHHKKYNFESGDSVFYKEKPNTLILLCEECHTLWHKYFRYTKMLYKIHIKKLRILLRKHTKEQSFILLSATGAT